RSGAWLVPSIGRNPSWPASFADGLQAGGAPVRSRRLGLGPQPRDEDAGDRGILVLVRSIAADADRAHHLAGLVEGQHAAGHRDEAALRGRREGGLESRTLLQSV